MQSLGERIAFLRESKGLSQRYLMEVLNFDNLSRFEKNERKPGLDIIISLAEYFGVSTDWILTGKGKTPNLKPDQADGKKQSVANEGVVEYKPPEKTVIGEDVTEDEQELLGLYRQLVNSDARNEIHEYINMKLRMQRKTRKGSSSIYVNGEEAATKMNA